MGSVAASTLSESVVYRGAEHELDTDVRNIEERRRKMELAHFDIYKNLKQEQEKKIMQMRQEWERKAEEYQVSQ